MRATRWTMFLLGVCLLLPAAARAQDKLGIKEIVQRETPAIVAIYNLDAAGEVRGTGTGFIVKALFPNQNYASSDFDARHIINANWVVGLPFGRGKRFLSNSSVFVDQLFGGWQTTGIFRWNSGLPIQGPFDCCVWATNWNVTSNGVRVRPIQSSTTANGANGTPNVFSDPEGAYQSFRPARSGEVGDRNVLRAPA